MTIEELVKLGLSQDQSKAVQSLFKQTLDGKYVPKETFEAERQKVKDRDAQIKERDNQITELGKFKGTVEDLQKKVTDLTDKNQKSIKEYEEKIQKMEFTSAIKSVIMDKVYDPEDVISKLDTSLIKVNNGTVSGLEEQLANLQKSHPHYFKPQDDKSGKYPGFNPMGSTPKDSKKQPVGESIEDFATKLAEQRSKQTPIEKKVGELYFGEKSN